MKEVTRDVLERPYTVGGGGVPPLDPLPPFRPPPPPPLPMFEADGTIGRPKEEGCPSQPPPPPR